MPLGEDMTTYTPKVTEVTLHHTGPIGMPETVIKIMDEGTGKFPILCQYDQEIRMDMEELEAVYKICQRLIRGKKSK